MIMTFTLMFNEYKNNNSLKLIQKNSPTDFFAEPLIILDPAAAVPSVMSDSVRLHRRQPTRLPRPWDSPGKNTGVGCHFLLQCMKVKSESEAAQSCPTLSDPMDCSPPGSSVHGFSRQEYWSGVPLPSPILDPRRHLSVFHSQCL